MRTVPVRTAYDLKSPEYQKGEVILNDKPYDNSLYKTNISLKPEVLTVPGAMREKEPRTPEV